MNFRCAAVSSAQDPTEIRLDPFSPSTPVAAYFDAGQNAWVLSRYADVFAGLRESALGQTAGKHEAVVDEAAQHARLYAEVQADIERMSTEWWRAQMAEVMAKLLAGAKLRGRADLVRDVIQPWSRTMLVLLNGGGAADSERLREISERMFPGASRGRVGRKLASWRAKRAQAELDRMLASGRLRIGRSMFFGLTQTLTSFWRSRSWRCWRIWRRWLDWLKFAKLSRFRLRRKSCCDMPGWCIRFIGGR